MVVRHACIPGARLLAVAGIAVAPTKPCAGLQKLPVRVPPTVPAGIPPLVVLGIVARSLITTPLVGVTPLPGLPIRSAAVRWTRAFGVTRHAQHSSNSSSDWNTYTFTQIIPDIRETTGWTERA